MSAAQPIRINKYLAQLGIASRRKVDTLIQQGRISVNGTVVTELGTKINPHKDAVTVNGKEVSATTPLVYLMLNKPKGVISTVTDTHNRPTVRSLVKTKERLYPVGRLDQNTEGLLLLTNDGELTYKLTHPKFHIPKTYEVTLLGTVKDGKINHLRHGVELEDGITGKADITILKRDSMHTVLTITIYEGRKRQIRRMCATSRLFVLNLKRIAFGPLTLGDLAEGTSRPLTDHEVKLLNNL